MFKKISTLISGDPHKKKIEGMVSVVDQINALEPDFGHLSDDALTAKTTEFRTRLTNGEALDSLLPEAFAAVREASKRTLGLRHYDVQLICGINLHQGAISELRTGEGKTLAATLPLYLNALEGKGAHLITVNDYLARRDGRWMGAIFNLLGLSVGILQMSNGSEGNQLAYIYDPNEHSLREESNLLRPVKRRDAYNADITYGTNSEFGFDYLRDNITMSWDQRVQRGHHYAIIDEVDNILIDEARTPLIISGPSHEDSENYIRMAQIAKALNPEDYEVDEKDRTVTMTEVGIAHVEELLGQPLSDPERPEDVTPEQARILGFLEQSLRAQFLFHRNKDYIVQGGEVIIVDEFTGRMMPGRRWSDGLHQAIEAKEGTKVQAENITHATITIQNYFRMYNKLAGMTGTALTEQEEFFRIYGLEVLAIPTNLEYRAMRPNSGLVQEETRDEDGYKYTYYINPSDPDKKPLYFKRKDYPDVIYRTAEGKLRAIVLEIIHYHVIGRPQLVGTTSVESSERLSERLSSQLVRRLIQTALIRQAWTNKYNPKGDDYTSPPELAMLNEPLAKLRMPDLRKLGSQYGLESLDLDDPSNRSLVLQSLNLTEQDWPRLQLLFDAGVPHQVLNARKHTEESLIIAGAGAYGAVTIATNMAGRGVDIKLGGEIPESLLAQVNQVLASVAKVSPYNMTMEQRLEAIKSLDSNLDEEQKQAVDNFIADMNNMEKVRELGGLHVIGSERHEARRIDNQLRGRAARQGDPGSSRFFLSLDDDLMRLFGGGQVESLLSRFKVDENMPIEANLIAKVVEQSQTRVEGANFDVRKHLLEYDDVLNAQRQRIYTQRDLIFNKADLRDDVTEMLRTELGSRVKSGLEDPEGPWKLLAYLEEIQPTLNTPWADYPSYTFKLVLDQIGEPTDEEELTEMILNFSQDAVEAEHAHLLENVKALLDKSEQNFKGQLAERGDALDTYLENFDASEPHDLQAELTSLIQIPLRLAPAQQKTLLEDPMSMKTPLRDALKTGLTLNIVRRTLLTLEQRFNETWPLKATELATQTWSEIRRQIMEQVNAMIDRRKQRLLGTEGEIARDLSANREHLTAALEDQDELLRLLQLTTQGTRVTFDSKSHRRKIIPSLRLTYIFSMAKQLEKAHSQQVTEQVLEHLEGAQSEFISVFGNAEWEHLKSNGFTLSSLAEKSRLIITEQIGQDRFEALATIPLEEIPEEDKEIIVPELGNITQNRIYRQLLLGTISETWVDYLTRMEALRISISMESYAQRDPLVQYKSQASTMFSELLSEVRQTVISKMFRYRPSLPKEYKNSLSGVSPATGEAAPVEVETPTKQTADLSGGKRKQRKRH
ncbi:MAG: hypothetical protein WA116_05810 [Anaerolineaceae bacterium]